MSLLKPSDELLCLAMAKQFGFRPRGGGYVLVKSAQVLLVLYRNKGPMTKPEIAKEAGLGSSPITVRTHIHNVRQSIGNSSIQQTGDTYVLTAWGRVKTEQGFWEIRRVLEEAIENAPPRYITVPYPSFPAHT